MKVEQKHDEMFHFVVPEAQASVSNAFYFLRSSSERSSAGSYVRKRKGEGSGEGKEEKIPKKWFSHLQPLVRVK